MALGYVFELAVFAHNRSIRHLVPSPYDQRGLVVVCSQLRVSAPANRSPPIRGRLPWSSRCAHDAAGSVVSNLTAARKEAPRPQASGFSPYLRGSLWFVGRSHLRRSVFLTLRGPQRKFDIRVSEGAYEARTSIVGGDFALPTRKMSRTNVSVPALHCIMFAVRRRKDSRLVRDTGVLSRHCLRG